MNGFGPSDSALGWFCGGCARCSGASGADHLRQRAASTVRRAPRLFEGTSFWRVFPSCTRLSSLRQNTERMWWQHTHFTHLFAPFLPLFLLRALSKLMFYWVSSVKLLFIPPLGTFTELVTVWSSLLASKSPNRRCLCHPHATGAFTGHSTHDDLVTKADYSTYGVSICLQYGIDSHYRYRSFQIRPAWPNTWHQYPPPHLLIHTLNQYTHVFPCIPHSSSQPGSIESWNDPQHPLSAGRWVRAALSTVKWLLLNVANTTGSQTRQEQMGWWCGKRRHKGPLRDVS